MAKTKGAKGAKNQKKTNEMSTANTVDTEMDSAVNAATQNPQGKAGNKKGGAKNKGGY